MSRIESHNSSLPLFLYVAYQAPHGPIMEPPATYLDLYREPLYNSVRRRGAVNRHATISVMMTSRHTVYWDMGTMDGLERGKL